MHTFEITIQRKFGSDWPVVALRSQDDSALPIRTEGFLRLDRAELENLDSPRDYGTLLGKALFDVEIFRAFDVARGASEDRLHVLLFIEDDDLRTIRWERLCAPLGFGWDFLCLNQQVPFSLYLPSTTDRRFPPIRREELRTLILAASPKNLSKLLLDEFDAPAAAASVRTALGEIPSDILAESEEAIGPPTLNALMKSITNGAYSLLHLICHGRYDSDSGETALYLADDNGEIAMVTGSKFILELSRLVGAKGLPHFVFLSACEAGTPEAEEALGSLANQLVRKLGIPAVVAMTGQISIDTAALLSSSFYPRLREHGQVDLALVEAYAALTNRQDINVPVLYSRLGGRPLFIETSGEVLTPAKIGSGLTSLESLLRDRAPVLLKAFEEQAVALTSGVGATGAEIEQKERALAELSAISLEVLDLSFESLAFGKVPPPYDSRRPFRGLYPFRSEDQEFFFGREALIETLSTKLRADNFLAVLGPSGSGKSSVVLAGLIPLLQQERRELVYMTPGPAPLAALKVKLQEVEASRDPILVIDQFEELFTHGVSQSECKEFVALLLSQRPLKTILTMRADFWGECAPYPNLKEIMQANQELIAPMDAAELRRAMDLQAEKVGLRFEADLSGLILDGVQDEPGAMPLLQHALQELWRCRHGRWLRIDEYRKLGGVKRSIARTADEVYEKLLTPDQDQVREIFMRLTRLDEDDSEGKERRDTRQRVRLESLVPAEGDATSTKRLVKLLADARLVVTSRNVQTGQEEVEVAHEALIRYWPKLRDWLDRDRMGLIIHRRLMRAAEEWRQNQRDGSYLYEGVRLTNAKRWAADNFNSLNSQEREFLFASILEENTEIGEWINRYGGPEKTLALAKGYLSAERVDERAKGLTILGSISNPLAEQAIDELLLQSIIAETSESVSLRAAEVLSERGRTQWLVEQLGKPENKPHRKQLIRALGHLRNRLDAGLEVDHLARKILPGKLRRAIRNSAMRRLIYTYRTQFAIVLSFTFLAIEIGVQAMSRLTLVIERFWPGEERASLPYGSFNLIATVLCGLYLLLRANLDRRAITVKDCFRAALWGSLLSEFIYIFGRLIEEFFRAARGSNILIGVAFILINSIDTLVGMMLVALVLRVFNSEKTPLRRFVVLSIIASAGAIFWGRMVSQALFALILSTPFNLSPSPLPIVLSLLLGATTTFACYMGFRFGVLMSADSGLFRTSLGLERNTGNQDRKL